jgi:hypothetical protein
MTMQAESLEVLEKASVAPAQARAIVRAIEIEIAGAKDTLATKQDVFELRSEVRQAVVELRDEISKLAAELRGETNKLGAEQLGAMDKLRGELHAEIHRAVAGSTRQMYAALLGHMAMTLGFVYFLFAQMR